MSEPLSQQRKKASDLSLGLSHDSIYNKAMGLVRAYRKTQAPEGLHLDFGAGRGDFIRAFQKCEVVMSHVALDLMEAPTNLPESVVWKSADLNEDVPVDSDSIDVVTSLEVIEHLENPRHMMRELFRILKSGGFGIVSTPNNESYRAMLCYWRRGHFVAFTPRSYPAHITALNRMDLERVAKEAGFEILGFEYTDHGVLPGWTRFTWQQWTLGVAKGLRFSDNLFIVLRKPA